MKHTGVHSWIAAAVPHCTHSITTHPGTISHAHIRIRIASGSVRCRTQSVVQVRRHRRRRPV